jgi:triacylglycerol lipase
LVSLNDRIAAFWMTLERLSSGLKERFVQVDSLEIPYLETGNGPPLILIHGFGGDGYNFARVARHLRRRFRVLIPDLPGFGKATRAVEIRYSIDAQADRIEHFMRALGIGSAHIGGNSMGGFIAARIALRHPHRVESLWLLNALGCPSARHSQMYREYEETGKLALIVHTPGDFDNLMKKVSYRRILIPRSVRRVFIERAQRDATLHAAIAMELSERATTLTEQNARITQPTLLVWGAEDQILSPDCIPEQKQVFPNHDVIVMPRVGHLPMLEQPRRVALDYLAFVDSRITSEEAGPIRSVNETNR